MIFNLKNKTIMMLRYLQTNHQNIYREESHITNSEKVMRMDKNNEEKENC